MITTVLKIHREFGVVPIDGVEVISLKKSNRVNKKYMITVRYKGMIKNIHFGDTRYEQYEDRTNLKAFKSQDHRDTDRRINYLKRATQIRNSKGLAVNDAFSPNRYAVLLLW